MSFASSGGAAAANTATSATATSTGSNGGVSPPSSLAVSVAGLDLDAAAAAEEATMAEVDDAFAMLLSLGTVPFMQCSITVYRSNHWVHK